MFQPLLDAFTENASPLLELSQNTSFKIYRKAYQKSLPLLRLIRRWIKNKFVKQTHQTPCAIIADATFLKPAILAPKTKLVGSLNSLAV
ncbi:hypothetical protein MMM100_11870 [Helicobacter pylori]